MPEKKKRAILTTKVQVIRERCSDENIKVLVEGDLAYCEERGAKPVTLPRSQATFEACCP